MNKFKGSLMKKELNKTKSVFVKKSKMSLAKSTTALTCLIGSLIIVSSESGMALTSSGGLTVSGSVSSTCSVSGAAMSFDPYEGSLITATSEVTVNCTTGTSYTISLATIPDTGSTYYLTRTGSPTPSPTLATNQLNVIFTANAGATTLTNGVTAMTGTGTGSSATAGTITGTMAATQTGKTAGTFNKTMTLNIVY